MIALIAALSLAAPPRLSDPVAPVAEAVAIDIDPEADTFTGTATIDLTVTERISGFHLHGEELEITGARLRSGRKTREVDVTVVDHGQLFVDAGRRLKTGEHTLEIDYVGPVHDQPYGLFRFTVADEVYLASQMEADEARTAWPCFDEPAFKIPFSLTVTAPAGLAVVSNEPVEARTEGEGTQTVTFETTPPMSTYLSALAIGPYEAIDVPDMGVPTRIFMPRGHTGAAAGAVEELPGILSALEDWFGEPYPYDKLDFIASTDFTYGAMENPGAIVVNERLFSPPERETMQGRSFLVEALSHELAHQWFGNLVTMAWWDDLWLNESFAQWVGAQVTDELHPEFDRRLDGISTTSFTVRYDGYATARELRTEVDPAAVFETANMAVYSKGEALLSVVEAWIGREAFQAGLRAYLETHRWDNATAEDLFGALSDAAGVDVAPMMTAFLDRPGAPMLSFALSDGVAVTQSRYAARGADDLPDQLWAMPLVLRVGRPDGSSEVVRAWIDDDTATLDLGDVSWVLPAADGVGYFAWDLNPDGWAALDAAWSELTVAEQVAVLRNARLLVTSGARDAGWSLQRVEAIDGTAAPSVVSAALALVRVAWVAEDLDDEALEAKAHAWVRTTLSPVLQAIGTEAQEGEAPTTGPVRRKLLAALSRAGDAAARAQARSLAEAFLDDPAAVDPELAGWALGVWAEDADASVQEALLAKADEAGDPSLATMFRQTAASLRDPAATERALALALAPETSFMDMLSLVGGVSEAKEDDKAFVAEWVLANFDEAAAKMPPPTRMYLAGIGHSCDLELFERTQTFFADPARDVPGVDRVLAETEEGVRSCIAEREAHGEALRAFFSE